MLLQRKTDYALWILRALKDGERHSIADVSKEEAIPLKYAYKIVGDLRKGKIIKATRGVNGGCQLIGDLEDLSLYDLIEAVEGRKYVDKCLKPGFEDQLAETSDQDSRLRSHLQALQNSIDSELKTHHLSEMLA